jgi:hypothetical protein
MNASQVEYACGCEPLRSAAEDIALQLGWLRECPYHGQPFRGEGLQPSRAGRREAGRAGQCSEELISFAMHMVGSYAERCPMCAFESAIPE